MKVKEKKMTEQTEISHILKGKIYLNLFKLSILISNHLGRPKIKKKKKSIMFAKKSC